MPTNLPIDDGLLREALKAGGKRTKRETVNEALTEYIHRRRRRHFAKLFGNDRFPRGLGLQGGAAALVILLDTSARLFTRLL
jgi:Arc/MetJ family transcription regulator